MAIFIIDDDPHILNLVSGCLEWQGHDVLSFSSPIKAIKTLKTTSPELVILDIDMPKINGFKVLEELRQKRKYIPVIFLTGRSDRLEVIEGLDKGADDYLVKPFDARELMARVAAQWRIKSMRNDLEEANKFLKKL
ncbi:MAG: response regulator, partial [Endozoicomonadaceae bacterium]|nr:response regulator [Endozoicomonadaceae bacterium]